MSGSSCGIWTGGARNLRRIRCSSHGESRRVEGPVRLPATIGTEGPDSRLSCGPKIGEGLKAPLRLSLPRLSGFSKYSSWSTVVHPFKRRLTVLCRAGIYLDADLLRIVPRPVIPATGRFMRVSARGDL